MRSTLGTLLAGDNFEPRGFKPATYLPRSPKQLKFLSPYPTFEKTGLKIPPDLGRSWQFLRDHFNPASFISLVLPGVGIFLQAVEKEACLNVF